MARPRRDPDAVPTVERILLAAEVAFGAEGFTRARLSDIAATAGIRRPSLLYHFKTKELLYDAVVHRLFDQLRIQFAATAHGRGTFDERLLGLMQCWLDFISNRPAFAPMLLRGILDGQGPVREHLNRELVPLLDWVEAWVSTAGAGRIPDGIPLRAALLQLGSNALVRAASGPLRDTLWGEPMTLELTRMLLMVPVEE
ncbi:MAG: TetR/AcrR family transcriptional regulator [Myxococcota bacterium]|nr:TetR/AcrR family transcriptional regulator [Myxococcota bacterium]